MTYQERLKRHLADYKRTTLGLSEPGVFRYRGRDLLFDHILPVQHAWRNLLPDFEESIRAHLDAKKMKRHWVAEMKLGIVALAVASLVVGCSVSSISELRTPSHFYRSFTVPASLAQISDRLGSWASKCSPLSGLILDAHDKSKARFVLAQYGSVYALMEFEESPTGTTVMTYVSSTAYRKVVRNTMALIEGSEDCSLVTIPLVML